MSIRFFVFLGINCINICANDSQIFIDFDVSMSVGKYYRNDSCSMIKKDPTWNLAKGLYVQKLQKDPEYKKIPRIPKIIHQIWLGSPFPEKYKKWQQTWIQHHPDWEYKLWTDKDIDEFGLENADIYYMTKNYGARSDIARYEILYREGGLYVDTDFECLKQFDILHYCCDCYLGIFFDYSNFCLANGIIGVAKKSIFMKNCINSIKMPKDPKEPGNDIFDRTGPFLITRCYKEHLKKNVDITIALPSSYFFPWDYNFQGPGEQYIKPESFAIHHYECSWANAYAK